MISVLANSYDKEAKLLNGTHKSHVHSSEEASLSLSLSICIYIIVQNIISWMMFQARVLAKYKPKVNATLILPDLKEAEETITKALEHFKSTRHIVLYYEDLINNQTVSSRLPSYLSSGTSFFSKNLCKCFCLVQKLKDVQEFLRLPYRELSSRQVKIHNGNLSKQIGNWNEVQQALNGTSFEEMLHADYQT